MTRCPRDPRHSWIVNATTELPTGYAEDQLHWALTSRAAVLRTAAELRAWLEAPE
jgi:hypothetical protein